MTKGIVIGFILAIAISVGCVFIDLSAGMAPVATADAADLEVLWLSSFPS